MSDSTDPLDIQTQIAQIARSNAETRKFVAEQQKLMAEQQKRIVEADKLRRDRFLAPILAAGALGGFIAAILPAILRSWGVH